MADIPCPYCGRRERPNPECGGCRGRGVVRSVDLTSVEDLEPTQYMGLTGSRLVQLSCSLSGSVDVIEDPVAWLHRQGLTLYKCVAIRKVLVVRPHDARQCPADRDADRTIYNRLLADTWLPWLTDRGWEVEVDESQEQLRALRSLRRRSVERVETDEDKPRVDVLPRSLRLRSPSAALYDVCPGAVCPAVDVALARERFDVADELARVARTRGRVVSRLMLGNVGEVLRG